MLLSHELEAISSGIIIRNVKLNTHIHTSTTLYPKCDNIEAIYIYMTLPHIITLDAENWNKLHIICESSQFAWSCHHARQNIGVLIKSASLARFGGKRDCVSILVYICETTQIDDNLVIKCFVWCMAGALLWSANR